ncbi:unnamed protein product [Trichobilharzia regenti]|nr:unnamed protein product [Trichobilharzia regenti]
MEEPWGFIGYDTSQLVNASMPLTMNDFESYHQSFPVVIASYHPEDLTQVILAIIFQMFDNIFYLIELTGFAFAVISAMAVGSLLHIRRTHPEMNTSGFRLPIWLPVLYLVVDIAIGILTVYQSPKTSAVSLGVMALGIPVYLFGVSWKNKPKSMQSLICKLFFIAM